MSLCSIPQNVVVNVNSEVCICGGTDLGSSNWRIRLVLSRNESTLQRIVAHINCVSVFMYILSECNWRNILCNAGLQSQAKRLQS